MIENALRTLLFGFTVFVFSYFIVANVAYMIVHVQAFTEIRSQVRSRKFESVYQRFGSPFLPDIAIIVPAYNEEPVIVSCVNSILDITYPEYELIVVNDGSTDETLDRLAETFGLVAVPAETPWELPCEPVHDVYRSPSNPKLTVIDKANGGKADALNAGIFFTRTELFCSVDADSIIERTALLSVIQPFLEQPERIVATGGVVRVANGCTIWNSRVKDVRLSRSLVVGLQTMEYLRAFLSGRIGLSGLQSLMIISGAFGVYNTQVVREIGGYSTDIITEDMELVIRLHRHLNEQGSDYRIVFVPDPVAWTEVPEQWPVLSRQRRRWHRGLFQSLARHQKMIGNPNYGVTGLIALPFFLFIEGIGPLIEGLGYVAIPLAFVLGVIDVRFFLTFLLLAVALGTFLSWLSVLSEVVSFRRYERPADLVRLLGYGVLENVVYRQWKTIILWRGFLEFVRGKEQWGVMERVGISSEDRGEYET